MKAALVASNRASPRTTPDTEDTAGCPPRLSSPDHDEPAGALMTMTNTSPHLGVHLVGHDVTFPLRASDQASPFNTHRHYEIQRGRVMVAYDRLVVVRVPGWRFAHTVPFDAVTEAAA